MNKDQLRFSAMTNRQLVVSVMIPLWCNKFLFKQKTASSDIGAVDRDYNKIILSVGLYRR